MKKRKISGSSHESAEKRRADLLKASIKCFTERGYTATSIDKIAEQAGLSKGSVYRFFPSKDDILIAILVWMGAEIDAIAARALEGDDDPMECLRKTVRSMFQFIEEYRGMERVWAEFQFQDAAKPIVTELLLDTKAKFEALIAETPKGSTLSPNEREDLANYLIALHEGLLVIARVTPEEDAIVQFDKAWQIFSISLKG